MLEIRLSTHRPSILNMNQENNTMRGQKHAYDSSILSHREQLALDEVVQLDMKNWYKVAFLCLVLTVGVFGNGLVLLMRCLSNGLNYSFATKLMLRINPMHSKEKFPRGFTLMLHLAIADLLYLSSLPITIHDEMKTSHFSAGYFGCLLHAFLRVSYFLVQYCI